MNNFELVLSLLSNYWGDRPGILSVLGTIGVVINFMASSLLAAALFPPFLDTRRSRMTYGLSVGFFMNYVLGGGVLLLNSVINMIILFIFRVEKFTLIPFFLFTVFICVNGLSVFINSYIIKIKKTNMKEAAEKGMTEQAYWEQYLNPNRTSNQAAQ